MGNDGGSIPTRRELVREAARNPTTAQIKETLRELQEHLWTTCPISHKSLLRPIVSDCAGNLYNKDAILKFLIPGEEVEGISSKADCEEILAGRVKGLRDVVELKFEVDTEQEGHPAAGVSSDKKEGWICPVTAKQLGPGVKAVYVVPCGHVFSEEAIRQLKGDKCLQCNQPYTEENVIPILPTKEEDKQRLITRSQRLAEQSLTHSLKKAPGSKKRKKNGNGDSAIISEIKTSGSNGDASKTSLPKDISSANSRSNASTPTPSAPVGIKHAATAMLTARVLEEEKEKKKRRKLVAANDNLSSLFTKDADKGRFNTDFMTRGFSVPAASKK
ncbi:Rtf2 RING-finger-domain-containing protein [Aspergillus crustosus]